MTTRPHRPSEKHLESLSVDQVETLLRTHAAERREAEQAAEAHQDAVVACALELFRRDPDRLRAEIGELAGLSPAWAKNLAQTHGVPTPTSKAGLKARTDDRIKEMLDSDLEMPVSEAATKLGVSPERVRQYIRENNLPARPRRRPSAG